MWMWRPWRRWRKEQTLRLADGSEVCLRPIRPADKDGLLDGFSRLSADSRYRRFLATTTALSADALRFLTEVDNDRHVAWVATIRDGRKERGIGVARYVCATEDAHLAEAAIVVIDAYQRCGVGKALLGALVTSARQRNIRAFRAQVLADNHAVLHIVREAGGTVSPPADGLVDVYVPL